MIHHNFGHAAQYGQVQPGDFVRIGIGDRPNPLVYKGLGHISIRTSSMRTMSVLAKTVLFGDVSCLGVRVSVGRGQKRYVKLMSIWNRPKLLMGKGLRQVTIWTNTVPPKGGKPFRRFPSVWGRPGIFTTEREAR